MMDLRDQLAMVAIQGELASQRGGCEWANESHLAARAYGVADAMIAEREQLLSYDIGFDSLSCTICH